MEAVKRQMGQVVVKRVVAPLRNIHSAHGLLSTFFKKRARDSLNYSNRPFYGPGPQAELACFGRTGMSWACSQMLTTLKTFSSC